ncbi:MAG: urea transporter [Bacteroidetes bacterium]|nr:urea transporter [Bacteroidota bacterium]MBU1717624.1 urea transporter [Bacteroidota bacterium]
MRDKSVISFLKPWVTGVLNSYTQIFFSENRIFGLILMAVTFFDLFTGLCGLLSIVFASLLSFGLGLNKNNVFNGLYGFNALLVGLGIGSEFQAGYEVILIVFSASMLTLFVTVALEGVLGKYGLPYLSFPFLISLWTVVLATRGFTALETSERGIYMLNEMTIFGGLSAAKVYSWFNAMDATSPILVYFKSLGAIFFQYNILGGILIAAGLLFYSRIAFTLSVLGFASAYWFYSLTGSNINELSDFNIGFNFILTAIALGGYFIIPSLSSFLWVVLLTPLISFTLASATIILSTFQLPVFSLPFNIVVVIFLYVLKFRLTQLKMPEITLLQLNNPEKNLYSHVTNARRFPASGYLPVSLPFWGEWTVGQAHNGELTHKDAFRHAWDFVIADDKGKTFMEPGMRREDFYCYQKPVLASADGYIEDIHSEIPDNNIGDVNTRENWGNSIVIRHGKFLYSQVSHLKPGSITVQKGDYVRKGDLLGYCGNSGRSPEPHLHFQIQATPLIGSQTIDYPLGNYILREEEAFTLREFSKPIKGQWISEIENNKVLTKAFHFIPGQKWRINVNDSLQKSPYSVDWQVVTDSMNQSYFYCKKTNSFAYFNNSGKIHHFTSFHGDKRSALFMFWLSTYKVVLGYYKGMQLRDRFPLSILRKNPVLLAQDFLAPFVRFAKVEFQLDYKEIDDIINTSRIKLESVTRVKYGRQPVKELGFEMELNVDGIDILKIASGTREIEMRFELVSP